MEHKFNEYRDFTVLLHFLRFSCGNIYRYRLFLIEFEYTTIKFSIFLDRRRLFLVLKFNSAFSIQVQIKIR